MTHPLCKPAASRSRARSHAPTSISPPSALRYVLHQPGRCCLPAADGALPLPLPNGSEAVVRTAAAWTPRPTPIPSFACRRCSYPRLLWNKAPPMTPQQLGKRLARVRHDVATFLTLSTWIFGLIAGGLRVLCGVVWAMRSCARGEWFVVEISLGEGGAGARARWVRVAPSHWAPHPPTAALDHLARGTACQQPLSPANLPACPPARLQ